MAPSGRCIKTTCCSCFPPRQVSSVHARMETLARCCEPFCVNRILIMSKKQAATTTYGDVLPIFSGDMEFVDTLEFLVPLQVIAAHMSDCLGIDLTVPKVASLDPVMLPAYRD